MKERNLFIDFIIDNVGYIMTYFANTVLLLMFFYLFYVKVEFIYPVMLSLFVFIISFIIKWFKYKDFNKHINLVSSNTLYKLKGGSIEHQKISNAIEKIHLNYLKKISVMETEEREKRRLISQFIHALKTPITVIDMAAASLLKDVAGDVPAITDIIHEKEKILSNLDSILNILRLDEFASDYSPDKVNLENSLRNIINNFKRNFIYGYVVPRVEVNCETPIVLTDMKWNELMLEQFISNGIKYSMADENMKTLFFTIMQIEDRVVLSIKDEGIGIPEHDISRISEPYFTGENGRRVKNSSGIGLYIAYKIAHKLSHKIEVISGAEQGTEIKITYLTKL